MSVEPKRIQITEEMERILEEAASQPLIAESGDKAFRIYAERVLPSSPFTIDTVYGSLPRINGRPGSSLSDDELEEMIEAGKAENLRNMVTGMTDDQTS